MFLRPGHHSVSGSPSYEYKRAFRERGIEGLPAPPIPKKFPKETLTEIREKVIASSLQHPTWSSVSISDHLWLEGISASPSVVRNIWLKGKMETKYKRLLPLEEENIGYEL